MNGRVERPRPEETRPALTPVALAWRIALCLVLGLANWSQAVDVEWANDRPLFWLEAGLGLASFVIVIFRRSAPIAVATITACLSAFSALAAGPATLAAVSLATLRQPLPILGIGLLNFVTATIYTMFAPVGLRGPFWVAVLINLVANAAIMGWGMFIGSRRELLWTLRQRAARAEAEQELRVAQGRSQERERIAREMHDVLAHRITQISMQAGALAFRDDLAVDELRTGLGEIQHKSREAIHELRGVLGVLRDDTTGKLIEAPQPTYLDIAALIEDSRENGVNVEFSDRVDRTIAPVPDVVGRALFRIIQEALTNASKHAPGALVSVALSGSPARGIDVIVRNPLGFVPTGAPGSGLGLVGLAERAELRGGTLVHGREGPLFVLRASIPWSS